MINLWNLLYIVFYLQVFFGTILSETFVIHFQSNTTGSYAQTTDEWAEYTAKIPSANDFTACNWMKINFFSKELTVVLWNYCITSNAADVTIDCLDLYLRSTYRSSYGRNLRSF